MPTAEMVARSLLRRYGVVFRRLLERESLLPPWRELLAGLPPARGARRAARRPLRRRLLRRAVRAARRGGAAAQAAPGRGAPGDLVSVSAADPLNLAGIATPGDRLAALTGNRVLYRGWRAARLLGAGEARFFESLEPAPAWQARQALTRRPVPPRLRAYLGRTA